MADTKNLCAQIPIDLHRQVREHQEESGKSLGEYMTWLITTSVSYTHLDGYKRQGPMSRMKTASSPPTASTIRTGREKSPFQG